MSRPSDPPSAPLSTGTLLAYGLPAVAFGFYLFVIQFYFLKYATDVMLASPAVIGVLFGAGRLWDAVTDPVVGHWSDRTHRPGGRRRPWMIAGIPLLAASFLMVWMPPLGPGDPLLVAWWALSLFGFYTALTIYTIPHASLGVELSNDYHERTRVFGVQRMSFVIGMMLSFGAIGYISTATDPAAAAAVIAGSGAIVASAVLALTPLRIRERFAGAPGGEARNPFAALRDVLRNPHARVVLLAWFADGFSGGVLGVLAPFVSEYSLGRPDLVAVLPAAFLVPAVIAIPIWVRASRRFGKRGVWTVALLGTAACFAAIFFVPPSQVFVLCLFLAGAGACFSAGGAIGQSMLADTVDYDELQTGERKEGAYLAAWGFALKLSLGTTIALTGIALQASGFRPNVEQTETALLTMRAMFSGFPVLATLSAVAILQRVTFDAAAHAETRAALDERASRR